jgi:hypothetical protein
MSTEVRYLRYRLAAIFMLALAGLLALPPRAQAQTCLSSSEMDAGTANPLQAAARQYFEMSARGDAFGLRANAIPALASNFGGVEAALTEHKADLAGAQSTVASFYVLQAEGAAPLARAEFFCGIFNSPQRVSFVIPNLPPGTYAVVTQNVSGGKNPVLLTLVLQQVNGSWKLAGYTVKDTQAGGHDLQWYLTQARAFKGRGANLAAYLYYLEAWDLAAPVNFAYTAQRDKIVDEMQSARPADWPSPEKPLALGAAGKTYRVTQMFPETVGNDLDLIVKYAAVSDVSDTAAAFQDNMAVIKAVVARYPELRDAFAGVVARAVDASGRDYGSLLAMKDVK